MAKPVETVKDRVAELCEEIMDIAVAQHYDRHSDETFEECLVCGAWEEHAATCPIPAIKMWMNSPQERNDE